MTRLPMRLLTDAPDVDRFNHSESLWIGTLRRYCNPIPVSVRRSCQTARGQMARAARTCSRCPAIITTGTRCPTCTTTADKARGTSTERGYNSRGHARFRAQVLARDPICTLCHAAWATVADHYPTSRRDLVAQHLDPNNPARGRGLCVRCHSIATAAHQPGGWNAR